MLDTERSRYDNELKRPAGLALSAAETKPDRSPRGGVCKFGSFHEVYPPPPCLVWDQPDQPKLPEVTWTIGPWSNGDSD